MINKCKGYLLSTLALGLVSCNTNDAAYSKLQEVSQQMNEKCPVKMDEDMRMDSTSVKRNPLGVSYYYTVVAVNKDSLAVNLKDFEKKLKEPSQKYLDTSPETADFRKYDVSMSYYYYDKKGVPLFNFIIKPKKE